MATPPNNEEQAAVPAGRAVLFELENTAINGRDITYGVVKDVLKARGVKFNEVMFSRYCVSEPLKSAVSGLVAREGSSSRSPQDKAVDALLSGLAKAFENGAGVVQPGVKALLSAAAEGGLALGALSNLPEDQAEGVAQRVGLIDAGGVVMSAGVDEKAGPSADAWLKLAKLVGVAPSLTVVVTTSSVSCKAALSAGMRCVAIPDKFTAYEDFGGASAVLDELDVEAVEEVLAATEAP